MLASAKPNAGIFSVVMLVSHAGGPGQTGSVEGIET